MITTIAGSPSSVSVSAHAQVSAGDSIAGLGLTHTRNKPSLFPLVECSGLHASLLIPSIYSKHKISYHLLPILPLLRMKSRHQDNQSCPLFPDYLLPPPITVALPQLPSHTLDI